MSTTRRTFLQCSAALAHYRYEGLRYSQFFAAESAWERLRNVVSG